MQSSFSDAIFTLCKLATANVGVASRRNEERKVKQPAARRPLRVSFYPEGFLPTIERG